MLIPLVALPSSSEDVVLEERVSLLTEIHRLSLLGPCLLSLLQSSDLGSALDLIMECLSNKYELHLEGLNVDQDELATRLLDKGLRVVYFAQASSEEEELQRRVLQSLPRSRVGLVITIGSFDDIAKEQEKVRDAVQTSRAFVSYFLIKLDGGKQDEGELVNSMVAFVKSLIAPPEADGESIHVCLSLPSFLSDAAVATRVGTAVPESIHAVFAPAPICASPSSSSAAAKIDFLSAYIGALRSDRPDGLFTTVVCDEYGVCLGLVYSNQESIRVAVSEARGVYWSRSRGGLWRKGETSGMHQELLSVRVDCDGDALRFSVVQHGEPPAFCHLMTRTCWGNVTGIQHLQAILQGRKKSAPAGSYTKRLFDDPDLLRQKLLEEVQELIEATEPDHIAAEAADVMYFLLTRCVAAGVSVREIEAHLDARSLKVTRRPGNAKEWRTQAAKELLAGAGADAGASGVGAVPPP